MSDRAAKNGKVVATKPRHVFKNKAEVFGFIASFNELKKADQQLDMAKAQFTSLLSELGIEGFDLDGKYSVTDQNELVEVE